MGKNSMQNLPLEQGVIRLKTIPIRSQSKKEKRKVFIDAFLFLLFLNLIGVAIVVSCINNYLFLDQLLTGGFIVLALGTIKWISKEN
ncbi:hypothetical protein [Lentiprolixibacter aurantiacus]|uniref:Uncharacterized protein n=1 Tax=Lentiprolixibacter aurantiacus TaxID=2993939 RepID=A0AAE3MIV9_9FLAO|nr:hypothetical protein [Lentiprolixibacter aurantiacus]MCX2718243.1 hypothetical protein [Lentiprolixibacter aurantiacus]